MTNTAAYLELFSKFHCVKKLKIVGYHEMFEKNLNLDKLIYVTLSLRVSRKRLQDKCIIIKRSTAKVALNIELY